MDLRPYQNVAVTAIRAAYRNRKRAPLLVLPTATGKTVVFSHIASSASAKGNRALILVHRVELLKQTHDKLKMFGVASGLINPQFKPDYDLPIQVASVQTGIRRLAKIARPDLIVIDEAHHAVAGTWRKIISHFEGVPLLGVTATPCRMDGAGLGVTAGGMFDEIVLGPSIADLIEGGYLARPVVYSSHARLDMTGVKTRMGDYDVQQVVERVDKPQITGDVIQHYKKLCDGVPAVVFCASVEHARNVAERFKMAGYRAESVDGAMNDIDRARILGGLADGSVQIVTSCDLISEGTDIPAVGAAILLRPTKSLALFIQQCGRALRPFPGKEHAIILDHVGNVFEHGMPDEERTWTLEGEPKKKGSSEAAIAVRQCPMCYMCHKPLDVCPACGHVYETTVAQLREVEGSLQKMDAEAIKQMQIHRKREIQAARSLDDLVRIQKERGYKKGWAYAMFKRRGGQSQRMVG